MQFKKSYETNGMIEMLTKLSEKMSGKLSKARIAGNIEL